MIFIVLSSLETVHDRIRLKRQNPLLSYVRERDRERERERESTVQMYNVVYSTLYYFI